MHSLRLSTTCALVVTSFFLAMPACSSAPDDTPTPSTPDGSTPDGSTPDAATPDAASPDAAAPTFPEGAARELQKALDDVARDVAPGAALVVDHPVHGSFRSAAGIACAEPREALAVTHRFRAGSMLKTAVATTILQLVERDQLTLEATVEQLLPAAIATRIDHASTITVRMLLNHTSGIPEYSNGDFDELVIRDLTHVWTLDELLTRVEAREPTGAPGAAWSYSNSNYMLLGEILVATTGQPWRDTVTSQVFAPLGLTDTSLPASGDTRCTGCAHGYESIGAERFDTTVMDTSMAGPAGGAALVTTTGDLATFLRALLTGKAFAHAATLQLMLDFTVADVPEEAQTGYGLGITRFQLGDAQYFGHFGGTAGYQGFMLLDPASGVVTSGFMNQRGNLGAFILPVLETLGRLP